MEPYRIRTEFSDPGLIDIWSIDQDVNRHCDYDSLNLIVQDIHSLSHTDQYGSGIKDPVWKPLWDVFYKGFSLSTANEDRDGLYNAVKDLKSNRVSLSIAVTVAWVYGYRNELCCEHWFGVSYYLPNRCDEDSEYNNVEVATD